MDQPFFLITFLYEVMALAFLKVRLLLASIYVIMKDIISILKSCG